MLIPLTAKSSVENPRQCAGILLFGICGPPFTTFLFYGIIFIAKAEERKQSRMMAFAKLPQSFFCLGKSHRPAFFLQI